PLLVADGQVHPSPFNRLVRAMVEQRAPGHEVAALLDHGPGLTKRRYAWTSPFATVLGKGPQRYGEALVRVELSPQAIIARLDPTASPPWRFRDGEGAEVSEAALLEQPSRLGAVFHLRVEEPQSIPFREWVLCNEAMVARWSVGTPAIAARVEQERRLVQDLAAGPFAALPPERRAWRAWPQWIDPSPPATLLSRWHRALAFDNARYQPSPAALAALDQALADYDPTGPALVGGSEVQASR
ncbi:MAG: hypothetical protein KDK70_17640, partial [Myxococcales bacterium]|nr:hypothetical protein [Myxococcales bacterium]